MRVERMNFRRFTRAGWLGYCMCNGDMAINTNIHPGCDKNSTDMGLGKPGAANTTSVQFAAATAWRTLHGSAAGTVSDLPLSLGPSCKMNGAASWAHTPGFAWLPAPSPQDFRSISVSINPGFSGTAAIPAGNSCASAFVKPSTANLLAQ